MTTTYPGTIQAITNPTSSSFLSSPSHSDQHIVANDTIEAIQAVMGTTAGTSVLKDFAAGQFPARVNAGGTILQVLTGGTINTTTLGTPTVVGLSVSSGTINNSVFGTPSITGGTTTSTTLNTNTVGTPTITGGAWTTGTVNASVLGTPTITGGTWTTGTINTSTLGTPAITGGSVNSANLGTPTITLGSDATGDLLYRSAAGTVARLAIGGTGEILRVSTGTLPEWVTHSVDGVSLVATGSNLTGGNITGAGTIALAGTIQPIAIGTTLFQGGTVANAVVGTSAITGGTATSTTLNTNTVGTPTITGGTWTTGTINTSILGTPTMTLGSDAAGDILYRSAGGTINRLGIGGTGQVLVVSAGTLPSWGAAGTAAAGVTLVSAGANLAGGDITTTGTISLAGTISPTMIGTTLFQGGTVANAVVGTSTITGGTATSTTLNSNTMGSPSITGGTWTTGTVNTSVLGTPTVTGGTWTSGTINSSVLGTPTVTGGTFTSPVISGAGGTVEGQHGYNSTNDSLLIGDGAVNQEIFVGSFKAFSSTIGGCSGTPSQTVRYSIIGRTVIVLYNISGTSNGATFTMTVPVASANAGITVYAPARGIDNGSNISTPIELYLPAATTTVQFFKDWAATAWTATGSKAVYGVLIYES